MNQREFRRSVIRMLTTYRGWLIGRATPEKQPHSPLFRAKHGLDERKSRIFLMKPQILGRKAKFFFTFCVVTFLWSIYHTLSFHESIRLILIALIYVQTIWLEDSTALQKDGSIRASYGRCANLRSSRERLPDSSIHLRL